MEEFSELYQKLDEAVNIYRRNSGLAKQSVAIGTEYWKNEKIRLLVIGRCLNGWAAPKNGYEEGIPAEYETKAEKILGEMFKRNNDNGNDLNKYPFWNLAKRVLGKLMDNESLGEDWYQNIAWYNLFPVAPSEGGNPSDMLIELTRESAKNLLVKVIDKVEPTHILFVTGWNYWIQYKTQREKAVAEYCTENELEQKKKECKYYEKLRKRGKYDGFMLEKIMSNPTPRDETSEPVQYAAFTDRLEQKIKVVVCRRPEFQSLGTMANTIVEKFDTL